MLLVTLPNNLTWTLSHEIEEKENVRLSMLTICSDHILVLLNVCIIPYVIPHPSLIFILPHCSRLSYNLESPIQLASFVSLDCAHVFQRLLPNHRNRDLILPLEPKHLQPRLLLTSCKSALSFAALVEAKRLSPLSSASIFLDTQLSYLFPGLADVCMP